MLTRWIIRLVVIVTVLLMGAFADAQQPTRGGGSTSSGGGSGGGTGSVNSGGGNTGGTARAPAPSSGNNKGASNSSGQAPTPPKTTGSSSTGTGSVITQTGPGSTSTGTPITGTGTPITQTPPTGNPNPDIGRIRPPEQRRGPIGVERRGDGTQPERRHRRPGDPNDPNRFRNAPTYVLPQTYGWAPYTWWFNGNSDWFPPAWDQGYDGNDGYVDRDEDRHDRVAPTTPTEPAAPTPAQVQAQSTNSLQGMPAYSQALVEFKAAQQAYEDASARVLAKLRKEPEYQRLVAQRERAEDRVEAVQAGAKIPPSVERVTPAAKEKLEVSSKVTKMEQDAIAADPEASAAKAKMVEANARLSALRKQAEASGSRAQ